MAIRSYRQLILASFLASSVLLLPRATQPTQAGPGVRLLTGSIDGAAYRIEVPRPWNGTLVLFSHGYVLPGGANPAHDADDPITHAWLLGRGYALAGSAYSGTGWVVPQALHEQQALLDYFVHTIGQPQRTIAWGDSMGGLITAGLIEAAPGRFAGALPMCGVVSGGVGFWNQRLDLALALKALLAPNAPLPLVHITDPQAAVGLAEQIVAGAAQTPAGRARLALVAAFNDEPGWYGATAPQPAPGDAADQAQAQILWLRTTIIPLMFPSRADLEARAGGNPSSTVGIDFVAQFARSIDAAEVRALYAQAGLSLTHDLAILQQAPRIAADPAAVAYLRSNVTPSGQITVPVLSVHTIGDGRVPVQVESTYAQAVATAGHSDLLRQLYVHRAGHCAFTPAETITAFRLLVQRLDSGQWPATSDVAALNQAAGALGPARNVLAAGSSQPVPSAPAFITYQPAPMLRPN